VGYGLVLCRVVWVSVGWVCVCSSWWVDCLGAVMLGIAGVVLSGVLGCMFV